MKEYIERSKIEYPYMTMTIWGLNQDTCHAYNEGVKAAADAIAAIPAADVVERKRGKWVEVSYWKNRIHYEAKRCSVCGAEVGKKTQYNGCPYCFADMRGEKHEP